MSIDDSKPPKVQMDRLTPLRIAAYSLFAFIGLLMACIFFKPEYVDVSKSLVILSLGYVVGYGSSKAAHST